jgi:outer membrane lipoprotein-sorting protein
MKRLVAGTLILVLTSSALAQTTADERLAAKIHAKLEKIFDDGASAKIEMKDGRKLQGHVAELDPGSFVLAVGATSNTFSYSDVKRVWRFGPSPNTRKWISLGFLGGLLGLTFYLAATQTR